MTFPSIPTSSATLRHSMFVAVLGSVILTTLPAQAAATQKITVETSPKMLANCTLTNSAGSFVVAATPDSTEIVKAPGGLVVTCVTANGWSGGGVIAARGKKKTFFNRGDIDPATGLVYFYPNKVTVMLSEPKLAQVSIPVTAQSAAAAVGLNVNLAPIDSSPTIKTDGNIGEDQTTGNSSFLYPSVKPLQAPLEKVEKSDLKPVQMTKLMDKTTATILPPPMKMGTLNAPIQNSSAPNTPAPNTPAQVTKNPANVILPTPTASSPFPVGKPVTPAANLQAATLSAQGLPKPPLYVDSYGNETAAPGEQQSAIRDGNVIIKDTAYSASPVGVLPNCRIGTVVVPAEPAVCAASGGKTE